MSPEEIIREGWELVKRLALYPFRSERGAEQNEDDASFLLSAALGALEEAMRAKDESDRLWVASHDALKDDVTEAIARAERAEAALVEADDTIRFKEQLCADAQSIFEQASMERDQWMELVGADAKHNTPEQNEAIYDDIDDAIKRHRSAKGWSWANVGNMIRDGLAAEAALAKVEAELEQTRETASTALAHVVLLSERAEKAEADRDEARRMYCKAESLWEREVLFRPRTPRQVAEQEWPASADRLFPGGGK